MNFFRIALFTISTFAIFAGVRVEKIRTVYTSLKVKDCKTIDMRAEEAGSYRGICKGVGGYELELLEGDLRQSINVISPTKQKTELHFWSEIHSGFSSIGDTAEWRVSGRNKIPQALIVRFNASENPEDSTKITSYLVVIKLSEGEICITDVVKPGKNQNEEARELADTAAVRKCRVRPD